MWQTINYNQCQEARQNACAGERDEMRYVASHTLTYLCIADDSAYQLQSVRDVAHS